MSIRCNDPIAGDSVLDSNVAIALLLDLVGDECAIGRVGDCGAQPRSHVMTPTATR
jgi:hypothetical protein